MARLFRDCECVIATHNDTKTVHSHIIVNAVNPITGKKLRFNRTQYATMKDETNFLGEEMGFTPTNFRKKSENKRTPEESHIILKGGNSWKEDLREVIEEAKIIATSKEEFAAHLGLYNVKVTRSIAEYSFLHPEKEKAIRGKRLGQNYSKEDIENAFTENRHEANPVIPAGGSRDGTGFMGVRETVSPTTATGAEHTSSRTDRQRSSERSVSDIQREMQRINQRAEYAHRGDSETDTENGNQPYSKDKFCNKGDGSGISASLQNQERNPPDGKNRNNSFSK